MVEVDVNKEEIVEIKDLPDEGCWPPCPPVEYNGKIYIINWSWQNYHLTTVELSDYEYETKWEFFYRDEQEYEEY